MATLIDFSTQQSLKPISANNEQDFEQIMIETEVKDLQPLLGPSLYQDLIQNPSESKYTTLINGTTWTLSGKTYLMSGLKYVLAYLFYANYISRIENKDTFSGFVQHQFDESNPISWKNKENYIKETRIVAAKYWDEVELYIENNLDTYDEWMADQTQVFRPKIRRLDLIDTCDDRCPTTGKRYIDKN